MKRMLCVLLALSVLVSMLWCGIATAETWYVYTPNGQTLNLRDSVTNKIIGHIPYGTALEPDESRSTQTAAYVTYNGISGLAKWSFLQREMPEPRGNAVAATPTPVPEVLYDGGNKTNQGTPQSYQFEVTAQGAYIQYANKKNKGEGKKYETLEITSTDNIVITADVPKGKKIDYWVINGLRYDFSKTVKSIRLTDADEDYDFEVVYTKSVSQSLISAEDIQAARTDEVKEIKTVNAKLCHVSEKLQRGGGWLESFDFTNDYTNRVTKKKELGGQITAYVKASATVTKKVEGWKFNETKLYPNSTVTYFIVHTLNRSMVYEPIFIKTSKSATVADTAKTQDDTVYCKVICHGCSFSGSTYKGATAGVVPAGTQIKVVNQTGGTCSGWEVNGSALYTWLKIGANKLKVKNTSNTITRTINKDTTINCYGA